MNVRKRFRQLIEDPKLLVMPGAYDGLSARLIEEQGFDAITAGGYAAAGSMMGQPDNGQLNMRDLAAHYGRICDAVSIPVYADADTCFGGVNNVRQTVRAFERAGVAGLFFTDQVFPSRCGYLPGKHIIPVEQMLAKINAALDVRQDSDLVICARTDVASIEGEEAAIERCQMFMEAGVDMAKPQGIDSIEGIKRVMRNVKCPHFSTLSHAAGDKHQTHAALAEIGVAAATYPQLALFAAAKAVREVLGMLKRDGSLQEARKSLIPLQDYYELVRLPAALAREEKFDVAAAALVAKPKRVLS
jgi:2-methylisocitrate lyase-like PEP mutase family enzyme